MTDTHRLASNDPTVGQRKNSATMHRLECIERLSHRLELTENQKQSIYKHAADLALTEAELNAGAGDVPLALYKPTIETLSAGRDLRLGAEVWAFAQVASTNDVCNRAAVQGHDGPLVVLADSQTAGRGRRGEPWHAEAGSNILMSVLLNVQGASGDLLALAVSLAVVEALEKIVPADCRVKWPNDVLIAGRKVAGVLIEKPATGQRRDLAVIGIGINIHQRGFPPELSAHAISLAKVTDEPISRLAVVLELLAALQAWVYPLAPGPAIINAWKSRCDMLGKTISVATPGRLITGRVEDIDPVEGLVIRDGLGMLHHCPAAGSQILRDAAPAPTPAGGMDGDAALNLG